jgi:hypothetical protein
MESFTRRAFSLLFPKLAALEIFGEIDRRRPSRTLVSIAVEGVRPDRCPSEEWRVGEIILDEEGVLLLDTRGMFDATYEEKRRAVAKALGIKAADSIGHRAEFGRRCATGEFAFRMVDMFEPVFLTAEQYANFEHLAKLDERHPAYAAGQRFAYNQADFRTLIDSHYEPTGSKVGGTYRLFALDCGGIISAKHIPDETFRRRFDPNRPTLEPPRVIPMQVGYVERTEAVHVDKPWSTSTGSV